MIQSILEFFERLITDFSWQRASVVGAIVLLVFLSVFLYEGETGTFALQKTEREIALIERLTSIADSGALQSEPKLRSAYSAVLDQLLLNISGTSSPWIVTNGFLKVFASVIAWLILILLMKLASPTGLERNTMIGVLIAATPFVLLSLAMPDFENRWVNYVVYPLLQVIFVVVVAMYMQRRANQRSAT